MKKPNHDFHHRKPRSRGGDDREENLVQVPIVKHQAWHTLFNNCTPEEIAAIINETWLDADYRFVVQRRLK